MTERLPSGGRVGGRVEGRRRRKIPQSNQLFMGRKLLHEESYETSIEQRVQ